MTEVIEVSEQIQPKQENYVQLQLREQVLIRPNSYIGSILPERSFQYIYDSETEMNKLVEIDFNGGVARLFYEVIQNACDNAIRSRSCGVEAGIIEVSMNSKTVTVSNGGMPIPIVIKEGTDTYVVEMIFGSLLSSSNYGDDREGAGMNGLGAKLTNLFSSEFRVSVDNAVDGLSYSQKWKNNMAKVGKPKIKPYEGKTSKVTVSYTVDFERFGMNEGYSEDFINFLKTQTIAIGTCANTIVSFNDEVFDVRDIEDLAKMYFDVETDNKIRFSQEKEKKGNSKFKALPEIEMIVVDSPNNAHHLSFVNGIFTPNGGVHLDQAISSVSSEVVDELNKKNETPAKKGQPKKRSTARINQFDVRQHLSVLVIARVTNPSFESQSKKYLEGPKIKITIPKSQLRDVITWDFVEQLEAILLLKQGSLMKKTDGKKSRYIAVRKGRDANKAGTEESDKCTLILCEGDSASCYSLKSLQYISGGCDYYGVMPLKGKIRNVRDVSLLDLQDNKEICEIKERLGLCEGVDYTIEENRKSLRYGRILGAMDSDVDGKHIIGLVLNFFACLYPGILISRSFWHLRTPIIRVQVTKKCLKSFYTNGEYHEWREQNPDYRKMKHYYFKGLGTSSDKEIEEDTKNRFEVEMEYDSQASKTLNDCFNRSLSQKRKDMILNYSLELVKPQKKQTVTEFLKKELVEFFSDNVRRSLPGLDSFKTGHRKIFFYAENKFKPGDTETREKVAAIISSTTALTNYHHAEGNMEKTLKGMAQGFPGTNNVPIFENTGQFGGRNDGGKGAAARYLFTRLSQICFYIYRPEDRPILNHLEDEGMTIEPDVYYPIIPMILVNGSQAIGSGWSTYIPCHNPIEIIDQIIKRINEGISFSEQEFLLPYFARYRGLLEVCETEGSQRKSEEELRQELFDHEMEKDKVVDFYSKESRYSLITRGRYHVVQGERGKNKIIVTELPIGVLIQDYDFWLTQLIKEKKLKEKANYSSEDKIEFVLEGFKDEINHRNLKLERSFGMSNMIILDEKGIPHRYEKASDIMEEFYPKRLDAYVRRKEYQIGVFQEKIQKLDYKLRLIRLFLKNPNDFVRQKKEHIFEILEKNDIPQKVYLDLKLHNVSEEDIETLEGKIAVEEKAFQKYQSTPPEKIWLSELQELKTELMKINDWQDNADCSYT